MNRQEQLSAGFGLLASLIKAANEQRGDLSQLNTNNRSSLVESINETLAAVSGIVSSMIDDTAPASDKVYSSQRTETYVNAQIGSAIMAALEGQDLSDIAASVAALAQADNGLISALADQMFTDAQQFKARQNTGSASQADLTAAQNGILDIINGLQSLSSNVEGNQSTITSQGNSITQLQAQRTQDNQARVDADNAILSAIGDPGHDFAAEINAVLQS